MIRRIYSDLATFRKIELRAGLNVLLADKSEHATNRQTRNGAGKTSLIELIHFIFGSEAGKESIFRTDALAPWRFGIEFDLAREPIAIERSGTNPSKIVVASGGVASWPIQPELDRNSGELVIPNTKWRSVLAELLFGLVATRESERGRFAPTFRSLFSYFVRRQDAGGFKSHLEQSIKQQSWDQQVAISYLIGLDWSISQKFQELREQEKTIQELKRTARTGTLPGFAGTAAQLRTRVTVAESRAKRLRQQLDTFNVVPEYQQIEQEAASITQRMNRLGNENTADRQFFDQLRASLESEQPPEVNDLSSMYEEAGLVLPELVRARFEEAAVFHRAIIENRKAHLRSEMEAADRRIVDRDREKTSLDARRSELMEILRTGGALQQYTLLQEELARLEGEAEALRQQLSTAERLESSTIKAEIERRQLQERLRQDYDEQSEALTDAIVLFEELSEELYERERAGSLTIDSTENGPTFDVRIEAQRSRGITNMQIFCFDMMLTILAAKRGLGPGFLVHDSHLFDGVDERQIAKALQLGKERSEKHGFQYLVTMNSDALPSEGFAADFDISKYILGQKLDDTEIGSLFGLRFN